MPRILKEEKSETQVVEPKKQRKQANVSTCMSCQPINCCRAPNEQNSTRTNQGGEQQRSPSQRVKESRSHKDESEFDGTQQNQRQHLSRLAGYARLLQDKQAGKT